MADAVAHAHPVATPHLPLKDRPQVPAKRQMLFCVGAQKAGTTWLAANLSRHSECHFYPFEKELHYFDVAYQGTTGMRAWKSHSIRKLLEDVDTLSDDAYTKRLRRIQAELNLMRILRDGAAGAQAWMTQLSRNAGDARYLCDFTPDYAYAPPGAFQEMAEYVSPEGRRPKFIFIMRDPVDRYWSFLRMMILHRQVREKMVKLRLSQWLDHDVTETDLARRNHCDYRYTVEQLSAHVPPQDVLYLFYETMFEQSSFDRICDFLEIERRPAAPEERVHEGIEAKFPKDRWADVRRGLDDIYQFVFDRFGEAVPHHWRRTRYR